MTVYLLRVFQRRRRLLLVLHRTQDRGLLRKCAHACQTRGVHEQALRATRGAALAAQGAVRGGLLSVQDLVERLLKQAPALARLRRAMLDEVQQLLLELVGLDAIGHLVQN